MNLHIKLKDGARRQSTSRIARGHRSSSFMFQRPTHIPLSWIGWLDVNVLTGLKLGANSSTGRCDTASTTQPGLDCTSARILATKKIDICPSYLLRSPRMFETRVRYPDHLLHAYWQCASSKGLKNSRARIGLLIAIVLMIALSTAYVAIAVQMYHIQFPTLTSDVVLHNSEWLSLSFSLLQDLGHHP